VEPGVAGQETGIGRPVPVPELRTAHPSVQRATSIYCNIQI